MSSDDDARAVYAAGRVDPPACVGECRPLLRARWAEACEATGARNDMRETQITYVTPLFPADYEWIKTVCRHGVVWYIEPTSEQLARWIRECEQAMDEWIALFATRDEVAVEYAKCLRDFPADWDRWSDFNQAIIRRWSLAGLRYIKEKAWKIAER